MQKKKILMREKKQMEIFSTTLVASSWAFPFLASRCIQASPLLTPIMTARWLRTGHVDSSTRHGLVDLQGYPAASTMSAIDLAQQEHPPKPAAPPFPPPHKPLPSCPHLSRTTHSSPAYSHASTPSSPPSLATTLPPPPLPPCLPTFLPYRASSRAGPGCQHGSHSPESS